MIYDMITNYIVLHPDLNLLTIIDRLIRGNRDLSHSVDLRMKVYVGRGGLLLHITGILKRLRNTPSQVL